MEVSEREGRQPQVWRADSRFRTSSRWLESRSSFSFGPHYDPGNTGFGSLVVNNHEFVRPGQGFDAHPHNDAEIVTWVLSGALVHQDSEGRSGIVYPGLAQRMSAGSGILHSERNDAYLASDGFRVAPDQVVDPVEFVQMWVLPDDLGATPSYAQQEIESDDLAADWVPVASGQHPDAAIMINSAGSTLWASKPAAGSTRMLPASGGRTHLYVARGEIDVESIGRLGAGDAVRLDDALSLRLRALTAAEVLVWELAR